MPQIAMLPAHWRPEPTPLLRLGARHDGGYVVPLKAVEAANSLLSFGVERDWSFEKDFAARKKTGFRIDCFDPTTLSTAPKLSFPRRIWRTLSGRRHLRHLHVGSDSALENFFGKPAVKLHQLWIGDSPDINVEALSFQAVLKLVGPQTPFFLKIDIEGSEWGILDEILNHSGLICGIAIEFHGLDEQHRTLSRDHELFRKFAVCNVHANNNIPEFKNIPDVIEFSLLNRSLMNGPSAFDQMDLNRPNQPGRDEIKIDYLAG